MLKLNINHKNTIHEIQIESTRTISELKEEIRKLTNIPVVQQELSVQNNGKKSVFNDDDMPLSVATITQGRELAVKNLGKQIKWDYVFLIQYGGPLLILPLLYLLGNKDKYNQIQCAALVMGLLHYVKREYQTAFVHVFSRYSMPFKRVFINSIHYWIFFALMNGIEIFLFPKGHSYGPITFGVLIGIWAVAEFSNFQCHRILASFRSKKEKTGGDYVNSSKQRGIPYGWGFNQVSCANYFWEVLGWLIFAIITRAYTSWLFFGLSLYQMLEWAIKKHKIYKKQFGDKYPKGRKAMIPFII